MAVTALLFCGSPAFSQSGTIEGIGTGFEGKIVPGATLVFDRLEPKGRSTLRTDKKGHYLIVLTPGTYSITVTLGSEFPTGVPRNASARIETFQIAPGSNSHQDFDLMASTGVTLLSPVAPKPKPYAVWTYKAAENFGPTQKPWAEFAARFLKECEAGDLSAADADTLPEQRESVRNARTIDWISQHNGIALVEFTAFRAIPERNGASVQGYVMFKDGLRWNIIVDEKMAGARPLLFLFTEFRQ